MKRGDYTTRFGVRHAVCFLYHARRWKRPRASLHRPPGPDVRITANQLTLGRLLLLPLPVYLIHVGMLRGGGFPWLVAALLVFLVLGLTDAWDGMLARRYGSTPLGSLLDTVADKIFLVGTYGVLAQHGIVPLAPVAALFVRELAVTRLRGIALEEKFSLPTSRIAKLKTTAQMAGSGFLLLIWILPEERAILPLLFAIAGGAALGPAGASLRGRTAAIAKSRGR